MEATEDVGVKETKKEVTSPNVEKEEKSSTLYDLHIRVPEALRDKLKDTAKTAQGLGLIEEPELRLLMALFIDYGMIFLRTKWHEKMGY